jgi:hypothetical protein
MDRMITALDYACGDAVEAGTYLVCAVLLVALVLTASITALLSYHRTLAELESMDDHIPLASSGSVNTVTERTPLLSSSREVIKERSWVAGQSAAGSLLAMRPSTQGSSKLCFWGQRAGARGPFLLFVVWRCHTLRICHPLRTQ